MCGTYRVAWFWNRKSPHNFENIGANSIRPTLKKCEDEPIVRVVLPVTSNPKNSLAKFLAKGCETFWAMNLNLVDFCPVSPY